MPEVNLASLYLEDEDAKDAVYGFEQMLNLPVAQVMEAVAQQTEEERALIYEAAACATAADGSVHQQERKLLRQLADVCGQTYDEAAIRALAARFR